MQKRPYKAILVEQEGALARITLNRPLKRNAIGVEMINELRWAMSDASAEGSVRVLVITGAGKAFCAGGDFQQMTAGEGAEGLAPYPDGGGDYAALLLAMCATDKPIVSRVNGHAMGGGLGLVAASTFAIAATSAQLGTPEIDVGLFPMMIMAVLERLVPRRKLVSMMLLGERLEAQRAVEYGILDAAVPPEALDDAVKKLCDVLAAKAPLAVAHGLSALAAQDALPLAESLPMLRGRLGALLGTEDAREGLMAFLEKRVPKWTGR